MEDADIEKENSSEVPKDSGENKSSALLDKIGSQEFYQGEKIIEDVELPDKKKSIKAKTVDKEEIYEDKVKKQKEFIASLGRKKEAAEKSENKQPKYVEVKSSPGKKIAFSVLAICALGAIIFAGYRLWTNKKQEATFQEAQNHVVIPVNPEPEQAAPKDEQSVSESKQTALTDPTKLKIKVLNEGAAVGSAGKVKTLLSGKRYAKAEAGNGELDSAGTFVYYSGQAKIQDAEAVNKILSDNSVKAKTKEALTSEQKSADIVVILGK